MRLTISPMFAPALKAMVSALAAAAVALLASPTLAQPVLVDFELLPGMGNTPGSTIPVMSRLSDQYLASHGVRFSSGAPFVPLVIHGPGTPSGTRIVGGSTPDGQLTYQPNLPVVAEFFDSTGTRPMVVSVASIRGDLFSIPGTKTLEAFNLAGVLIASQTLQDSDPAALMVSAPGIHRVRSYSSSATVGFDDLRFDIPQFPCEFCPADFNCDSITDFFDYLDFVDAFSAQATAADFNGDTVIDFFDYLDFVDAFSTGC